MGIYYTILEELRIRTRSGILLRSYSYTKRCKSTIHGKQCRANCKAISIAGYNAGSKFSVSISKNCTHVATLQDWALICQLSHWHSSEEQKPRQGVTLMLSVQVLPLQSSLEFIPLAQSSAFRFYIISLSPTGEEWSQVVGAAALHRCTASWSDSCTPRASQQGQQERKNSAITFDVTSPITFSHCLKQKRLNLFQIQCWDSPRAQKSWNSMGQTDLLAWCFHFADPFFLCLLHKPFKQKSFYSSPPGQVLVRCNDPLPISILSLASC